MTDTLPLSFLQKETIVSGKDLDFIMVTGTEGCDVVVCANTVIITRRRIA